MDGLVLRKRRLWEKNVHETLVPGCPLFRQALTEGPANRPTAMQLKKQRAA